MKNSLKYSFMAALGLCIASLSACSDDYKYEPAPSDTGGNAYLVASKSDTVKFTENEAQKLIVRVARVDSTQAQTIALSSDNKSFNAPTDVKFAAGEGTKDVEVAFNMTAGTSEKVSIAVASKDAFIYGLPEITYHVIRYKTHNVTVALGMWNVQSNLIVRSYGNNYMLLADKENGYNYDINFTIDDKGVVTVPAQPAWDHKTYGKIWVCGNEKGDAKSTANGVSGSAIAGTYDAKTKVATLKLLHAVPGKGAFGTKIDYISFK